MDDVFNSDIFLSENLHFLVQRGDETKDITLPRSFGRRVLNMGIDSFIEPLENFSVGEVLKDSSAYKAGLKEGDSILAVNGHPARYFAEFVTIMQDNKNKAIDLAVLRYANGKGDTLHLNAKVSPIGTIGFDRILNAKKVSYSFGESFTIGFHKAWKAVFDTVRGLWRLVKGDLPAKKSLHGLIGIATYYGGDWDWFTFWALTGTLSMVLAFMNLLPIPALDGGHVLFLLVEMVRRRPVSYRFLEIAQMVGMVILFLLMGFAIYNDITEYVIK
jgi:regulator of sigma E protease